MVRTRPSNKKKRGRPAGPLNRKRGGRRQCLSGSDGVLSQGGRDAYPSRRESANRHVNGMKRQKFGEITCGGEGHEEGD